MTASALVLRPLRMDDEEQVLAAQKVMWENDHFEFAVGRIASQDWPTYVDAVDAASRGIGIAQDWVPATFLVAAVGNRIVGRTSIRHRLNVALEFRGGHIG